MAATKKTRWTVRKSSLASLAFFPPWEVVETPDDRRWFMPPHFDTWQEAMEFVDQRKRTREVVLPRTKNFHTVQLNVERWGDYVKADADLDGVRHHFNLPPKQLEGIALYLYALSEKQAESGPDTRNNPLDGDRETRPTRWL